MNDSYPRQSIQVLLPVLGAVHRILDANLDKLEHVNQALGAATKEEAKKIVSDKLNAERQKSVLALGKVKEDQNEKNESKVDLIDKKSMGGEYFEEQANMRPSELQEWRGKLLEACHTRAGAIFKSMLNGLNSERRASWRGKELS